MHRFFTLALTVCLAAAAAQGGETVRIKGSDTIGGALAPDLAAAFRQDRPAVTVTVESLGSGTAFVGLFDGSADLGASSRPANSREMEQAASRGVVLREWILGFDGVAVIVHASNPISGLTIAELSGLFSGAIKNWREVGGENRAVRVISRPSYSGTHAFFKEQVLRRGDRRSQEEFAASTTFLEHNEDIVNLVSREIDAVAYVGLGWVDPRARAAAHHLQELGVPAERLSVEGRAAEEPIATNESSAARAANRRVDISLLPLS